MTSRNTPNTGVSPTALLENLDIDGAKSLDFWKATEEEIGGIFQGCEGCL